MAELHLAPSSVSSTYHNLVSNFGLTKIVFRQSTEPIMAVSMIMPKICNALSMVVISLALILGRIRISQNCLPRNLRGS